MRPQPVYSGDVTETTTRPAAYILDLDPCDGPSDLCKKWAVSDMTVAEFDQCMREFAASKSPSGGYAKLRGTFAFVDDQGEEQELKFRIDVDHAMSEGKSLAEVWERRAEFYGTERGREYAVACDAEADELVTYYRAASKAARV